MHIYNTLAARNFIVLFLAFFIFADHVFSQNPTPTPESDLIRVNTDLIQTNITVVDKNNRFVDGLKALRRVRKMTDRALSTIIERRSRPVSIKLE